MLKFTEYLKEETITLPKEPNTLSLWHGGNLETSYEENKKQEKCRMEYGAGLYLTTHYDTAKKYAKGSRKFYLITIKKGNDLQKSTLPIEKCIFWVKDNVAKKLQSDIIERLESKNVDGKIKGYIFNNIILNSNALTKSNSISQRDFYIENGIDYSIEDNAFGWGERMVVLFNMKKIVDKKIISPKDKIEVYDLPIVFN